MLRCVIVVVAMLCFQVAATGLRAALNDPPKPDNQCCPHNCKSAIWFVVGLSDLNLD